MGENIAVTEAEDYIWNGFIEWLECSRHSKWEYVPLGPF
jgi:hypothetical protein